jgi:UV excision repair protein RAD23
MLLTFRTIGNKLYQIEASPSDTIRSVKERLASANAYDLTKMRLIFKAKVLPDSRTLAELGIDGSGFIVLHAVPVSAAAPAKAPSQPQNAPPAAAQSHARQHRRRHRLVHRLIRFPAFRGSLRLLRLAFRRRSRA